MRAAIYARYSSDSQRAASIEDQVRLCERLAGDRGWTCGPVYTDHAISGGTDQRPGYRALLAAVDRGECRVVVAESLDRLSRDQEHVAALLKRCRFAGVRLFTQAEGEVGELRVGLKGTMNALYLIDLADKTRRGLRGRVEAGASAGGLCYGYRVVPAKDGEDRGGRTIDAAEAEVVRCIFRDYAAGLSPKAIAGALNRESVPGPRGGAWSQSTINGNRERGTGVLNNELYVGVLVWNRLGYRKDPRTGRRRSQARAPEAVVRRDAPALRVIEQVLWDAVRKRQAALDARRGDAESATPFWRQRRPSTLLSGLLRCGACGGGVSVISATHVGCSNARNKGEAVCANRRTIKRAQVEDTVLDALRTRLMAPEVYAAFVRGFMEEWNTAQKGRAVTQEGWRDEVKRLERKIANFIDTIGEGDGSAAVLSALKIAEARKAALEAELAVADAPAPRLLPNLAEVYRRKVAALQEALGGEDAAAAREQIRGLIDAVRLVPSPTDPKAPSTIEVRGELAAMLALGSGQDEAASVTLASQMKLVAGA